MMDLYPRGERFLQVVHEELLDRGGHPHRCLCLARHFAVVPVAFGIQRPPKRLLRGLHGIVQVMRMTHTAGRLASATLTSPSAQPRTPLAAGQHFGKTPTVTHLQPRCHTGTDQVHAINKDVRRACGAALALGLLDAGQCIAGLYPLKVLQVLLHRGRQGQHVFAFWLFLF